MSDAYQQQVIALAAVCQAAKLVHQLASDGNIPTETTEPLLESIFCLSPNHFSDVYGDPKRLRIGLLVLQDMLDQSTEHASAEVTRYALGMLHLDKRLQKQPDMLDDLKSGIDTASRQMQHFGLAHANTSAALADVYKNTLSQLSFRIHVTGNPAYLQNASTANNIRTLLLAGIRGARLWRQSGGRRWHLLFYRRAYKLQVQRLLNP